MMNKSTEVKNYMQGILYQAYCEKCKDKSACDDCYVQKFKTHCDKFVETHFAQNPKLNGAVNDAIADAIYALDAGFCAKCNSQMCKSGNPCLVKKMRDDVPAAITGSFA